MIGVSADDPAADIEATVRSLVSGVNDLLDAGREQTRVQADRGFMGDAEYEAEITSRAESRVQVDDTFVGKGYGQPSDASHEAQRLAARTEALFLDHTYTAKAMAALIAYVRAGRFREDETVVFWHTGGQVSIFA